MAITLAVGTQIAIASSYGSALPFTAASNAAETVLTMAATTGLLVGDYVEVTSGWGLLTGRVVRVKTVTANVSIVLEGVDTTDSTAKFPAGGGAGSVRRVVNWTNLSQVTKDISIGGGDQQYADITALDDRTQRQIPTVRSPVSVTIGTFFDPALAWVAPVRTASDSAAATAVKFAYPNGGKTVGNAYWSLSDVPTINDNTLRASISLSYAAAPINYAT
jgi:hypothetical protein